MNWDRHLDSLTNEFYSKYECDECKDGAYECEC